MKLCKLYDVPEENSIIVGDDQGKIGIVTYEFMQAYGEDVVSKELRVILVDTAPYVYEYPTPLDTAMAFDTESIELHRYIHDGWLIRVGYGPRTKTWIVDGSGPQRIPQTSSSHSLESVLLQIDMLQAHDLKMTPIPLSR